MNIRTIAKIALRNTAKNRRRAVLTAFAVALGFVAFSLLEGYFTNVYRALEDQAVIGERLGHLIITKNGFYKLGSQDPEKYTFDPAELQRAEKVIARHSEVELVSPRLNVSGLISNGQSSRIFFGEGIDPRDMTKLRGTKYAYLPGKLNQNDPYGAVFGSKLAEYLGIDVGKEAVVMTSTIGGMVNAIDLKVGEIANTGSVATDDKFVLMPLGRARKLLAFDGADRIVIKLLDGHDTDRMRGEFANDLKNIGFDVEIKAWKEVSQYFNQVKGLFDVMNLFFAVVVSLVVMAVVTNTMGMSISERTREIGTMRALGMHWRSIDLMFFLEGGFITGFGAAAGAAITLLLSWIINAARITYTPPDASADGEIALDILMENLNGTAFTLIVIGAMSAYLIARRASRKNIVETLAHV